jgi:phosphoenolpyruvate carboxykinase (GTP)
VISKIYLNSYSFFRFSSRSSAKQSISDAPVEIINGEWLSLPRSIKCWARKQIELCRPEKLHIMDGSLKEDQSLKEELVQNGRLIRLTK